MNQLEEARGRINQLDAELAHLFEERMTAVEQVIAYKAEHNLPVFDAARERQVLEKNLGLLQNERLQPYFRQFLQSFMDISTDYQRSILQANTVAFAGAEGAFAFQAAKELFPTYRYHSCADFESVFQEVLAGRAAFGVIPFENSYTGEVGEVFDLLFKHNCYIQAICDLPVRQNLLALPGAKLAGVQKVYSHPQALNRWLTPTRRWPPSLWPKAKTRLWPPLPRRRARSFTVCRFWPPTSTAATKTPLVS